MAEFNIVVTVNPSQAVDGLNKVDKSITKTEKDVDKLRNSILKIGSALVAAFGVKQVLELADAFIRVQNNLKLVTTGTQNLAIVTDQLFDIAQRTRGSFEATAKVFSRTSLATAELGLTQRETLKFTESLNKAVALSGASGSEAAGGLLQFSQGLAVGALQGDELRSVLEGIPLVGDVIAKSLNVTRGELKVLGSQGKLTAEVIVKAFQEAASSLDADFEKTIPTLAQSFTLLRNAAIQEISQLDEAAGFTDTLSKSIIFLAENLETVIRAIGAASTALAVNFAVGGVGKAIAAVKILSLAIAANPIGAIVTGVVIAASALAAFSDQIIVSADGMTTLQDTALATFGFIGDALGPVITSLGEDLSTAIESGIEMLGELGITSDSVSNVIRDSVNSYIGIYVGFARAAQSIFNDIKKIISESIGEDITAVIARNFKALLDFVLKAVTELGNLVSGLLKQVGILAQNTAKALGDTEFNLPENSFADKLHKIGVNAKNAFIEGYSQDFVGKLEGAISPALDEINRRASDRARARQEQQAADARRTAEGQSSLDVRPDPVDRGLRSDVKKILDDLQKEAVLLRMVSKEREIQGQILAYEEDIKRQLNATERNLVETQLKTIQNLQLQADVLEDLRGPQQEIADRQKVLNDLYSQGSISLQQFNAEIQNLALQQAELNMQMGEGGFADGFILSMQAMIESARNFRAEAGATFGDFFNQLGDGFATAAADAIVFGDDIRESLGNVARQALAGLIGGLIKLGVQFALNAALGQAAATASTTAAVAQAGIIGAAYATPAALVSLASFGSNSIPASAGIASTVAVSQGLALAGAAGLKDGGFVTGPGGPRSDSVPAMLSNGEFVVNADATSRNRGLLESINSGRGFANGGIVASSPQVESSQSNGGGRQSQGAVKIVNVLDPSLLEDYLTSNTGERVLVNTIQRNATAVNAVLAGG